MTPSLSPPDGTDGGITVPTLLPYVPTAPVSSVESTQPYSLPTSSVEAPITYINSNMLRGNIVSATPSWMAPLFARFETFNKSKSYSAVREGQQGYCSPLTTTVVSSLNNEDKEIVTHTTSYMCIPMDGAYNSELNDACVGGPCPPSTGNNLAKPGVYVDKSGITSTPSIFNFLYVDEQNETQGYPLQWDTIPNNDIVDVIGNNSSRSLNDISPEVFLDYYNFDSIVSKGYVNKTTTASNLKILSFPTPTPGGTTFIAENNGDAGLEVTAVVGQAYSIQLPPEDRFIHPEFILYGEGTILYDSFGGINLSKFNGAIRTLQGIVIFSRPTYRYTHTGKNAVTVGNTEHLKSLRKFDPTFLRMANSLRLDLPRRSSAFEVGGVSFRSWDDPGSSVPIISENFDTAYYPFGSRNIIAEEFSFPTPPLNEFRQIRGEYIPYVNDISSSQNIFNKNIHRGVAATLDIIKNNKDNYEPNFFYDISLENINKSLRLNIFTYINNLPDKFGNPLNKNLFLQGFVNLMLRGRVDEFDANYIHRYYYNNTTVDQRKKLEGYDKVRGEEAPSIGSTSVGKTIEQIRAERRAFIPPPTVPPPAEDFMQEDIVGYAVINKKSLDFRNYSIFQAVQDKMKRRWISPEDVNVNLPILFPTTNIGYLYISTDKTIPFVAPNGILPVDFDINYKIFFNHPDGTSAFSLELNFDELQYCYALDRQEEMKVLKAGNQNSNIQMQVETPSSLYEFTADLSTPLSSVYYLKFDPSTIVDSPPSTLEDYIRETKVTYNVCSFEDVSALAAEYPWPNQTVYVYYDDPILDLLTQEGQAKFLFTTFSTDFLGYSTVRFPRWIPPIIYLIPTNKTEYSPFYGGSILNSLNNDSNKLLRTLDFVTHFDASITPSAMDTPTMLAEGVSGQGTYTLASSVSSWAGVSAFYTGSGQPSVRSTSPLRTAYEIITTLDNNFILANGLTEYDVWSRMGPQAFYGLKNSDYGPLPIKQLFSGSKEAMGNAATNVRVYKNAVAGNIVAASGAPYFNRSRIIKPKTDAPDLSSSPYIRERYLSLGGAAVGGGIAPGATAPGAPAGDTPSREDWA